MNDTYHLGSAQAGAASNAIYSKLAWRIIPIVVICYFFAYLDRVNVSFAKLQMLGDLKFSETAYGLGAGLFFVGYLIFEVPSNILMMKIGAKRTICRIMVIWGVTSIGFAFVQTPMQFYALRVLLGAAEAGFYPGIILYLSFWFPSARRAKMTGVFLAAIPLSGLIGSPISGYILDGLNQVQGLAGWRWLFILEGMPSLLLGLAIPFLLNDTPQTANWLSQKEKDAIKADLAAEAESKETHAHGDIGIAGTFLNARVWYLTALCVCQGLGIYGISFYLPSIIKDLGYNRTAIEIGWLSAIPFGLAMITLILVCRSSDRHLERRWHTAGSFLLSAFGLAASVLLTHSPTLSLIALTIASMGAYSATSMFWTLPSLFFTGMGMAAAIAFINSVGGLSGFVSPYVMGLIKDGTGSTGYAIYLLAVTAVIGAILALRLPKNVINR